MRFITIVFSMIVFAGNSNSAFAEEIMGTTPAKPDAQVTLMNLGKPAYNNWAFRNMSIQSGVMIPRSGEVSSLTQAPNPSVANIKFEYQGKPFTVRQAMIEDSTDGFIVIKDEKIVYEEYFGDFTEKDHHMWASSTKSLTALSMGILVSQGKIDVDNKVERYIEELKGTYFGQRTVREILNMVSALDYSEDYENFTPGSVSTEYFRRMGFLLPAFEFMAIDPTKNDTPRGILGFLPKFEKNPNLEPSTKFEYHSPNVDVAGWIIARISGQPLNKFIADNIWGKIGAEHDAFMMTDATFTPVATGGLNTTLRDFARVGLAVLNDGALNGNQIFPASWIDDTFALTDPEREHTIRSSYKDKNGSVYDEWLEGYKNYLWVHNSKKGIATFRGVYGQNLYINKEKNVVVATFSSTPSASNAARISNRPRMAAFEAISNQLK